MILTFREIILFNTENHTHTHTYIRNCFSNANTMASLIGFLSSIAVSLEVPLLPAAA